MMIFHNISAMNSQRALFNTNSSLDRSLERLSSGLRINSAADDASGLAISEKMGTQIAGLTTANQNAQDGQALYKIADGALDQISKMLTRMEELASRAANATLTTTDRDAVTSEINQLLSQISTVANDTEYNTLKVLSGSLAPKLTLEQTVGSAGSIRITDVSASGLKNAIAVQASIYLSTNAAYASMGTTVVAASILSQSGTINVNGVDISVSDQESRGSVVAKINAVNSQTNVIARVGAAGSITLVSGRIDADAAFIDGSFTGANATLGFAIVGSQAVVRIGGDVSIWTSLGHAASLAASVLGSNGIAWINGTPLTVATGGVRGDEFKSVGSDGTQGLTITFNNQATGVHGVLIKDGAAISVFKNSATNGGASGDTVQVAIDANSRLRLQTGANADQAIFDGIRSISTTNLGVGGTARFSSLADIDVSDTSRANSALRTIQKAQTDVNRARGTIGAMVNRLDYTIRTIQIQRENMSAAQARIQDADISLEMTNFTKQQILLQAGTAMLAQANARPQSVLTLLR